MGLEKCLHPCALEESSISIGRVQHTLYTVPQLLESQCLTDQRVLNKTETQE